MLEVSRQREAVPREDMETPLADAPGYALGPSGFRIFCTCSGTRKYQSTSAHSLGWRGAGGVPFVFLAPKGPDQAVPEAEREWGLKSQGCCRRGASMTKALGMQVCRSVLTGLVTPLHPEMWLICFPTEPSWWLMPLSVPPEDRGLPNPGSFLSTG